MMHHSFLRAGGAPCHAVCVLFISSPLVLQTARVRHCIYTLYYVRASSSFWAIFLVMCRSTPLQKRGWVVNEVRKIIVISAHFRENFSFLKCFKVMLHAWLPLSEGGTVILHNPLLLALCDNGNVPFCSIHGPHSLFLHKNSGYSYFIKH